MSPIAMALIGFFAALAAGGWQTAFRYRAMWREALTVSSNPSERKER